MSSTELKHEYPKKPNLYDDFNLDEVSIDPSKKLFSAQQVDEVKSVLKEVEKVFRNDDSTYKGDYEASFEFSSETRPNLKNCKLLLLKCNLTS